MHFCSHHTLLEDAVCYESTLETQTSQLPTKGVFLCHPCLRRQAQ